MSIINEDGRSVYRLESVWTEDTLAKAAREIAGKIDENVLARLGYFKRGTCHIGRGTSGLMHVTTGHCSECGAEVVKPARYCSNCGRAVEP